MTQRSALLVITGLLGWCATAKAVAPLPGEVHVHAEIRILTTSENSMRALKWALGNEGGATTLDAAALEDAQSILKRDPHTEVQGRPSMWLLDGQSGQLVCGQNVNGQHVGYNAAMTMHIAEAEAVRIEAESTFTGLNAPGGSEPTFWTHRVSTTQETAAGRTLAVWSEGRLRDGVKEYMLVFVTPRIERRR